MLEHLGFIEAATCITDAIDAALSTTPEMRTGDLNGTANTVSCGKAIAKLLQVKINGIFSSPDTRKRHHFLLTGQTRYKSGWLMTFAFLVNDNSRNDGYRTA